MSQGRFVQLGHEVLPTGPAADGFGQFVTVDALAKLERDRTTARINELRPDLLERGAKAMRAKHESDAAIESLRKEIHSVAGGDAVRVVMEMMNEEAERQIRADAAKAKATASKK